MPKIKRFSDFCIEAVVSAVAKPIQIAQQIAKAHSGAHLLCYDYMYNVLTRLLGKEDPSLKKEMAVSNTTQVSDDDGLRVINGIQSGDASVRGVQTALVKRGLGKAIDKSQVAPGDFVQFWSIKQWATKYYTDEEVTKDKKNGVSKPMLFYYESQKTNKCYVRDTTGQYVEIATDKLRELQNNSYENRLGFQLWGHCALVSAVKGGTIFLMGSGHEHGFGGVVFGDDPDADTVNRLTPQDLAGKRKNAFFVRLTNPTPLPTSPEYPAAKPQPVIP